MTPKEVTNAISAEGASVVAALFAVLVYVIGRESGADTHSILCFIADMCKANFPPERN